MYFWTNSFPLSFSLPCRSRLIAWVRPKTGAKTGVKSPGNGKRREKKKKKKLIGKREKERHPVMWEIRFPLADMSEHFRRCHLVYCIFEVWDSTRFRNNIGFFFLTQEKKAKRSNGSIRIFS